MKYAAKVAAVVLALAASASVATAAQVMQGLPPQSSGVKPGEYSHALKGPAQHVLYGTIVAVHTTTFDLRARGGQVHHIDPTLAIQSGRYSAPLFVGKIVNVEGYISGGTFHAQRITRMTKLDGAAPDH